MIDATKRSEVTIPPQAENTKKVAPEEPHKGACNVSAWAALFFFVLAGVASLSIYACNVTTLYQVYPCAGAFLSIMMGVRAIYCVKKPPSEKVKDVPKSL